MGEGEQLHEKRRRRFWAILGVLAIIGAVAGFSTGFVAGADKAHDGQFSPATLQLVGLGAVLFALATAYGSWRFFKSVDEVEVADNLWGSLIGFYVYAILFPTWWVLSKTQLLPPPDQWVIYGVSLATATAAYFYRKLMAR